MALRRRHDTELEYTCYTSGVEGVSRERFPIDLQTQGHELILPELTWRIMPGWLASLVISAIMAAIMSTASGFLLSVAGSMTEDVYHRTIRPNASALTEFNFHFGVGARSRQ